MFVVELEYGSPSFISDRNDGDVGSDGSGGGGGNGYDGPYELDA